MKKNLFLLLLVFFGIIVSLNAAKVDLGTAKVVGKNYYFQQINRLKATDFNSISISHVYQEMQGNSTLYYIFDINDQGFIIVAGDDACSPIIGYSFESTFTFDQQPENLKAWMENYKKEIAFIIQNNLMADATTSSTWQRLSLSNVPMIDNTTANTDVEPLLTSNWDQGGPYNLMCPLDPAGPSGHVLVGCVATAMAQVMYYWRYPMTGQGYHCNTHYYNGQQYCADFGNTTYDWNGATDAPTKECDPVALISYHAGISVNMDWGPDASGAYTSTVTSALRNYFKYSNGINYQQRSGANYTTWTNQIKADLDAHRPVIYAGQGPDGGHCFVCDGYQGTDMFHFNWGWSGSSNGYFTINNLNPGGMTFNSGQEAVFNIQPDPSQYPYNCNGMTNVTTYGFGTIEDGSGPIANYLDNSSCSWLIGPDDSVQSISLSFDRFELSATDELSVYDGSTTSAPLIGSYSGENLPPTINSTGSKMLVTFTTDGSTNAQGWLAKYNCTYYPFCSSVTTLIDLNGTITDGSDRFEYRNSSICKWKIIPDCFEIGSTTLSFSSFDTEQDEDKVQVYDLTNGSLLGVFSGSYATPPAPITSPSGKMLIIFNTTPTVRGAGWEASYSVDCLNVGVEKQSIDNLSVYPNPTSDFVTVRFTTAEQTSGTMELIATNGTVVSRHSFKWNIGTVEQKLDLSNLSAGVYSLRVITDKGVSTSKVVVR